MRNPPSISIRQVDMVPLIQPLKEPSPSNTKAVETRMVRRKGKGIPKLESCIVLYK